MQSLDVVINTKLNNSPIKNQLTVLLKKADINFSKDKLDESDLLKIIKVISTEYKSNNIRTDDLGVYFGNLFELVDKSIKSQSKLATFCLEMCEIDLYLRKDPCIASIHLNTLLNIDYE